MESNAFVVPGISILRIDLDSSVVCLNGFIVLALGIESIAFVEPGTCIFSVQLDSFAVCFYGLIVFSLAIESSAQCLFQASANCGSISMALSYALIASVGLCLVHIEHYLCCSRHPHILDQSGWTRSRREIRHTCLRRRVLFLYRSNLLQSFAQMPGHIT